MRTCSKCQRTLPAGHFQVDRTSASGRRSQCSECSQAAQRARRQGRVITNPDKLAPCPEVPLELGPAGIAPIAPVTPEEAHEAAPPGYAVKGVSTLYDSEGHVSAQWVKTVQAERDRMKLLQEALADLTKPFKGYADPTPAPEYADDDLLCVIPVGDAHIGLYTWAVETGADFNLEIAERNMVTAIDRLIAMAPPAATLLLINLGDFLHGDDPKNRTPESGHPLDIDTRWPKVVGVAIRTKRRCIDRGLEKFRNVIDWNVAGNHDPNSAVALRFVMQALYEREPRVTVDMTPGKFHWHRFGTSLIAATHGDSVKFTDLPGIMACDRPGDWGETTHRYWYTGHVHHSMTKEHHGVTMESFRTLAPKDSWHASKGYRAGQDIRLDVWHRKWGHINRFIVGIEQIREAA